MRDSFGRPEHVSGPGEVAILTLLTGSRTEIVPEDTLHTSDALYRLGIDSVLGKSLSKEGVSVGKATVKLSPDSTEMSRWTASHHPAPRNRSRGCHRSSHGFSQHATCPGRTGKLCVALSRYVVQSRIPLSMALHHSERQP